jgi:hypothetical protein
MDNKFFDSITTGNFHQRFFSFCESLGVVRVNVEYSGGGDSGGVDRIDLVFKDKKSDRKAIRNFFREELEEDLGNPIWNRHGSFADGGGYSVSGSVVYSIADKKAWIEGTDHFYEYTEDGDEENSTDEEWDEMIYDHSDEDDNYEAEDREYDFISYYAQLTDKPLSEVHHNHLVAAAIAGDEKAKEYMEWYGGK